MIRKLRAGMMPPPGARRPDASVLIAMAASFEARLDKAAVLNPNPGSRPFQRLNRAEYQNAVRDLLNVDVDVTAYLPPDTISHGFDNVADSQTFSPTLMDGYLRAASQISRLAVGDRQASATTATYKISRSASQMRHTRRRADGHARRHRRHPHVPGRRPLRLQDVVALRAARRARGAHVDVDAQYSGASGSLSERGARRVVRSEHPDERNRPEERARAGHSADSREGRPPEDRGGVHSAPRWADRRPADAAGEHAGRREPGLRRHDAAAFARLRGGRTVGCHRRVGHA